MLRSTDPSLLNDCKWMFDGEFRFLDGQTIIPGQKIAYNTYPRSGNSYLRKVLENITGVTTGATMSLSTATSL